MLYGVSMERATAEQREAFGHELERRLMGLNRAAFGRRVAEEEGRGDRPHSETQVSKWVQGEYITSPVRVFAIERALDATPGALSHLLGYLPIEARDILSVEDAIGFADGLDQKDRSMLIDLYQTMRKR